MSNTIKSINIKNKTAIAQGINNDFNFNEISIPSSITYKNEKYIVKSITKSFISIFDYFDTVLFAPDSQLETFDDESFAYSQINRIKIPSTVTRIGKECFSSCMNLRTFEIPEDSQLQIIGEMSFVWTSIEIFTIPSQVKEIHNGIFCFSKTLREIIVSPLNPYFQTYDDNKILITKTNPESTDFDCLVCGVGDSKTIKIPNFIKYISPMAFYGQIKHRRFELERGTKLEKIGSNSFSQTSITTFTIPASVKEIEQNAICECPCLRKIEFENGSELRIINEFTFYSNKLIENFTIPSKVVMIKDRAFCSCDRLRYVDFQSGSLLQIINKKAFSISGLRCFSIPPKVKKIVSETFAFCVDLYVVEVLENSDIESIDYTAFTNCNKELMVMMPKNISDRLRKNGSVRGPDYSKF